MYILPSSKKKKKKRSKRKRKKRGRRRRMEFQIKAYDSVQRTFSIIFLLTLCWSYLNHYCTSRKTMFFSPGT
jgi:hypothetical protein